MYLRDILVISGLTGSRTVKRITFLKSGQSKTLRAV